MKTKTRTKTTGLIVVPHPKDPFVDDGQIKIVERYKTSGLSGDEWRFSVRIELLRKGKVVAYRDVNGMDFAAIEMARALNIGVGELEMEDYWNVVSRDEMPGDGFCCQPGCPNTATRTYVMKKLYDRSCSFKKDNGSSYEGAPLECREFCDDHGQRGDCGLDDANANYVCVKGKDWNDAPVDPKKVSESVFGGVIDLDEMGQ